MDRTWIMLRSGRAIDLVNPDPWAWTDAELSERLGLTTRWSGSTQWQRPLSVAQHSLLVLHLRQAMNDTPSREEQLHALLHDAEEGLLGFDPVTPLKAILGTRFHDLLAVLRCAIAARYGLPKLSNQQASKLKKADRIAAALEARYVVGWSNEAIMKQLHLPDAPATPDPLFSGSELEDGYEPWEPWCPPKAAAAFHAMLDHLNTTRCRTARELA